MPARDTTTVFHAIDAMASGVQWALGVSSTQALRPETIAAETNCAVAPGSSGISRQKRLKYSVPATSPVTPRKASASPSEWVALPNAAGPTTIATPHRPSISPAHWRGRNFSCSSTTPRAAVSSGVSDWISAICAAGTNRMPTCGGIRVIAFSSAPATAQWNQRQPARGRHASRRTTISPSNTIAQSAKRIATNNNGDRSRNPVFDAMNAELHRSTNRKGTRRESMEHVCAISPPAANSVPKTETRQ